MLDPFALYTRFACLAAMFREGYCRPERLTGVVGFKGQNAGFGTGALRRGG